MSVAACLLLYAVLICVTAPRLLPRLTAEGAAPRFGVIAWLMVLASALASWMGATIALVVWIIHNWNRPTGLDVGACFAALRSAVAGHDGALIQLGAAALVTAAAAVVTLLAARVAGSLLRARARTHSHAASARIIGRRVAGVDAVVVEAPERAAYCLSGRPGTVVITSAAVAALHEPDHLDAVLSHERAHLAGRHPQLIAVTRALARALPRIRLFRTAEAEIARLLEMCADDKAVRTHGNAALLGAILALFDAGPIPASALGASSVDVCARVARLAQPPLPEQRARARTLLSALAAVAVIAPVVAGVAAANGLIACGPMIF